MDIYLIVQKPRERPTKSTTGSWVVVANSSYVSIDYEYKITMDRAVVHEFLEKGNYEVFKMNGLCRVFASEVVLSVDTPQVDVQ